MHQKVQTENMANDDAKQSKKFCMEGKQRYTSSKDFVSKTGPA